MITADNITLEQIDALWVKACGRGSHFDADTDVMHDATVTANRMGDFTDDEQRAARERCAALLNKRAQDVEDEREWIFSKEPEQRVKWASPVHGTEDES